MTQLELRRKSKELGHAHQELADHAERLHRRNAELDNFADTVAHELKGPLSQVVSNLEVLAMDAEEELGDEQAECLQGAREGAHRMDELINDLLAYSRASGRDPETHEVDLETIVDGVSEELCPRLDATNGTARRQTLPEVCADASLVRLVVANLAASASNTTKAPNRRDPRPRDGSRRAR